MSLVSEMTPGKRGTASILLWLERSDSAGGLGVQNAFKMRNVFTVCRILCLVDVFHPFIRRFKRAWS
jgi:hypothetical protein